MKRIIEKMELAESALRASSADLFSSVADDWGTKVHGIMNGVRKVRAQKVVVDIVGDDLDSLYDALDDALVLVERIGKKMDKASVA